MRGVRAERGGILAKLKQDGLGSPEADLADGLRGTFPSRPVAGLCMP